jgi:ribosome-binding protein aMBF1 (putative translation factor)
VTITKTKNSALAARDSRMTIPAEEVFAELSKQPGYQEAYDALEEEFGIMEELIKARQASGLSQAEIAGRMNTSQPAVARLEGMGHRASLKTLRSYAAATGHRVKLTFEPLAPTKSAASKPTKPKP